MKKLVSLVIVMALVLSLAVGAAAQEVAKDPASADNASITISNASKGVTYKVYKLFDATVNEGGSSIAYTGDIPASLGAYFTKDAQGNITATEAAKNKDKAEALSTEAIKALTAWAKSDGVSATASAVSNGSALTFAGLDYGYYVITSSQGNTQITVDSTKPNVTVVDKNSTTPGQNFGKTVNNTNFSIGDTVTYTVSFKTANYSGEGESAKQIISYTIEDTLPDFLSNVTVTSITIGGADYTVNDAVPQFESKKIIIPWANVDDPAAENKTYTSIYDNGAEVVIIYTAVVTEEIANITNNGEGVNKVSLKWTTTDNTEVKPDGGDPQVSVKSYAIAIKKVDQSGKDLAGATFQLPFYVKATPAADGSYIYAGANPGTGLVNTLTTPASGLIIIKGLKADSYSFTETVAPVGYNKLTSDVTIEVSDTTASNTSTTYYLDQNGEFVDAAVANGNTVTVNTGNVKAASTVVVNKTGTELPSTGGVGTTIFYALGSLMFVGALVLLVTNKRMKAE